MKEPPVELKQSSVHIRARLDGKSKVSQLLDMQAVLYYGVMEETLDWRDKAALACAWERLENRLNRMRMRPEPKPVDVTVINTRRGQKLLQEPSYENPKEPG